MAIIWKIPTDADFKYLEGYVDSTYGVGNAEWDGTGWRGDDAGDNLKDPSVSDWLYGTQGWDTGWDGLQGGNRNTVGALSSVGSGGYWWSSSVDGGNAWSRFLLSINSGVYRNSSGQADGFSVRCFRDTTTAEESDADGTIYTDDYEGNDGTKYDSIKLGNQVWITENLKETKWYDGTLINEETTESGWEDAGTNSEPALMGSTDHPSTYGYLYNWFAVDSSKNMINYDYPKITQELSINSAGTVSITKKLPKELNVIAQAEATLTKGIKKVFNVVAEGVTDQTKAVKKTLDVISAGTVELWIKEKGELLTTAEAIVSITKKTTKNLSVTAEGVLGVTKKISINLLTTAESVVSQANKIKKILVVEAEGVVNQTRNIAKQLYVIAESVIGFKSPRVKDLIVEASADVSVLAKATYKVAMSVVASLRTRMKGPFYQKKYNDDKKTDYKTKYY